MVHTLEQLFKGFGLELGQHQQNPLAGPQADVGLGQTPAVAGKKDPAVFDPDIFHIHPAQLVAGNALQSEKTGYRKFKLTHNSSIPAPQGQGTHDVINPSNTHYL